MDDPELASAVWWVWFWDTIETWAFAGVVITLAVEFAAHKFVAPHREKIEAAQESERLHLVQETTRLSSGTETLRAANLKLAMQVEEERIERLRLQAKYAWRNLSDEQVNRIADAMSVFSNTPYDAGVAHDAEPLYLLDRISIALERAHWEMRAWGGPGGPSFMHSRSGVLVAAFVIGINAQVAYDPSDEDTLGPAARALADALTAEGITTSVSTTAVARIGQIRLRIGSKPP